MSAKQIVTDFYKSDAFIDSTIIKKYIHPEIIFEWNNSDGFTTFNYQSIIDFTDQLSKAYIWTNAKITHIIQEKDQVTVRYEHYAKTLENPREEMLLGYFMTFWELKDEKLYRGFQISQKA
jgi:hypothetical protein